MGAQFETIQYSIWVAKDPTQYMVDDTSWPNSRLQIGKLFSIILKIKVQIYDLDQYWQSPSG